MLQFRFLGSPGASSGLGAWFKDERFRVTLSKPPFQDRNRNRYRNRLSSIRTMVAPKAFLDPDFDIDFDPDILLPWFEPGRIGQAQLEAHLVFVRETV